MSDTEDYSREAFMEAIVKLADDEAFRRSFLEHYQLWMHPPVIISKNAFEGVDLNLAPGGITFVSDEQMDAIRDGAIRTFGLNNGALREIKETP